MGEHSSWKEFDPFLHLKPEEVAHLLPEDLLQACPEFCRLLLTLVGIESSLTVRAVAMDLLDSKAQQLAQGQLADEVAPVVSDVKQVSEQLGLSPAKVRKAYEELAARGRVQILDRWFPKKRQQQLSLLLDAQTSPNDDCQKDHKMTLPRLETSCAFGH